MANNRRPYIGHILHRSWDDEGQKIDGLSLICGQGIAAHLTKSEAYSFANDLVDAADKLPEPAPGRLQPVECPMQPAHQLTDATGATEEPLPATPAD
ncbi:hypothetical protein [Glutamicibacter ardleyensis]|uniref:Uncharacterized protein n=1 Tax=Glutamicibacter ardleyensis TaxID=225894 RepID=A0ABQ2DUD0_9MICC|nr:hypothetical protein [Glutamicibacter ardleyensis]GGJ72864.1 hypothetical protein GCM10007173_34860 [Glutamicibacter ardleyensis]